MAKGSICQFNNIFLNTYGMSGVAAGEGEMALSGSSKELAPMGLPSPGGSQIIGKGRNNFG